MSQQDLVDMIGMDSFKGSMFEKSAIAGAQGMRHPSQGDYAWAMKGSAGQAADPTAGDNFSGSVAHAYANPVKLQQAPTTQPSTNAIGVQTQDQAGGINAGARVGWNNLMAMRKQLSGITGNYENWAPAQQAQYNTLADRIREAEIAQRRTYGEGMGMGSGKPPVAPATTKPAGPAQTTPSGVNAAGESTTTTLNDPKTAAALDTVMNKATVMDPAATARILEKAQRPYDDEQVAGPHQSQFMTDLSNVWNSSRNDLSQVAGTGLGYFIPGYNQAMSDLNQNLTNAPGAVRLEQALKARSLYNRAGVTPEQQGALSKQFTQLFNMPAHVMATLTPGQRAYMERLRQQGIARAGHPTQPPPPVAPVQATAPVIAAK